MLINQTTVPKALKGLKCSPENAKLTFSALNSLAEDIVEKSCENAKANGRKTILPADVRPFVSRNLLKDDINAAKSLKKVANHVFDEKVKDFMKGTPACKIGGKRMKISGLAGAFLDAAIEDKAVAACKIGGGVINAKILNNLI